MKLVKKVEIITLNDGVEVNGYYEMEDTLSCNKIVVKMLSADSKGIKVIRLSDGKVQDFTYRELEKYEVKKMKLVYDDNSGILSQAAKSDEVKHEISQKECEKDTGEYRKQLEEAIRNMFSDNVGVKIIG